MMLDMFNIITKIISTSSYGSANDNSGNDRYMYQYLDTCMLVCPIRS